MSNNICVNAKTETTQERCERLDNCCKKLTEENFELKGRIEDLNCDKQRYKHLALDLLEMLRHSIEMER